MNLLTYFLPLLALYPFIAKFCSNRLHRRSSLAVISFGPFVFLCLAAYVFTTGTPLRFELWSPATIYYLGLKLDVLSGLLCASVMLIGLIVLQFSVRYLEDDPRRNSFLNTLSSLLSCILLMILSPNLILLFSFWLLVSYFLHRLLVHFPERAGAQVAARQKFIVSRLGDLFILIAGYVLYVTFGTLDFETLFQELQNADVVQTNITAIHVASLFLVLGAMTKSAQYPFHYWLPNTMETPTPVSAVMHAGVINAGGYLMVRMSPLLSLSQGALSVLAIMGVVTVFWASLVMFTQTSIKKNLAYSTISQMGFMMLQCGLGLFPLAVVHIIGHSFYKAYAFLSSGTATDFAKLHRYYPNLKMQSGQLKEVVITACVVAVSVFAGLQVAGVSPLAHVGAAVVLFILCLAFAQIWLSSSSKLQSLVCMVIIAALYFVLSRGITVLIADVLPTRSMDGSPLLYLTAATVICAFTLLYLMQNSLSYFSQTDLGKKLYVRALSEGRKV